MESQECETFSKQHLFSWFLLALLFAYMLALNILMPLHRDDYGYALIWGSLDKIASWPDVFKSLYNHYLDHGGRMVAFFVLNGFLFFGKQWFNTFNAISFVALIILIYWHSQRKITARFNPYILSLIILFAWLGLPHFAEVNIWMTGACVYLLTAVLILTFILPYHFSLLRKKLLKDNFFTALLMFLGGIIAGWTIENTAATMTFAVFLSTLYSYREKMLQKWMISGLCGALTGFALLVIAPGNYVRYVGTKKSLIYHFTNLIAAGVETLFYLLPIFLFMLIVWRVLLTDYARKNRLLLNSVQDSSHNLTISTIVIISTILLMLLSSLNNNFFSNWLGDLLYTNVAVPMGIASTKLRAQFFNVMSGVEEMAIYLLIIFQLFRYAFRKSRLRKKDIKLMVSNVSVKNIMETYPAVYHAATWIALVIINHLVMVASPTFPARASYGSVVFLIVSSISLFTIAEVKQYLLGDKDHKKYLSLCIGILLIPMAFATLHQQYVIFNEDSLRMSYVAKMSSQGIKKLEVEPISTDNRVLRHVYFVDLNNKVSKSHLCDYFRLEDITLKQKK